MLFHGRNGQDKAGLLQTGVFILIGIVALQQLGIVDMSSLGIGGTSTDTGTGGAQAIQVKVTQDPNTCNNVEKTTYDLKNYNKYTTGTAFTDGNAFHRLFVLDGGGNVDAGTLGDGVTKSVAPSNVLTIYPALNASNRFGDKMVNTVPCRGTYEVQAFLAPIDYAPTWTWYNEDEQVNTAQNLAANDVVDFSFRLKATSKQAVGNPYLADECKAGQANACNRICFEANTTVVDKITVKNAKIEGVAYESVGVSAPRAIGNNLTGGAFAFNCWTFPPIEDGQEFRATLSIDTAASAPLAAHSINTSLAYVDYVLHTDTKAEIIGVEDNDFTSSVTNSPIFLANPIDID